MEALRMTCYLVGLLMSVVLAGQLLRVRHTLARLLSVAMLAWAVNCITLAILLYLLMAGQPIPEWRDSLTTLNAILLASMPAVLYLWFLRANGQDKRG